MTATADIAEKHATNLIPKADEWIINRRNALLQGWHGVGKTETMFMLAEKHGLKLVYYSCATLDPYTDLVGVPVPRPLTRDGRPVMDADGNTVEQLVQIRPHKIDEADWIVFDELNRASREVRNACMEIIQFRTINGEKLPNLQMCWAAINPDSEGYDTESLDYALEDRFDVFAEIQPSYSTAYMVDHGIPMPVARALWQFVTEHNRKNGSSESQRDAKDFISPRRLMKIAEVFMMTNDALSAIPPRINCERTKLTGMLERARRDYEGNTVKEETGGTMGKGAYDGIQYEANWMRDNRNEVTTYLADNPEDLDTHTAVMDALRTCHEPRLVRDHAEILNALMPSVLEGFIDGMNDSRRDRLKGAAEKLNDSRLAKLDRLREMLDIS